MQTLFELTCSNICIELCAEIDEVQHATKGSEDPTMQALMDPYDVGIFGLEGSVIERFHLQLDLNDFAICSRSLTVDSHLSISMGNIVLREEITGP